MSAVVEKAVKVQNPENGLALVERVVDVGSTCEQVSFLERPNQPVAATDVMRMISQLKPERSVRTPGVIGDWFQVGMALKHNESLLKNADLFADAELMSTCYEVFCMKSPETYPGKKTTFNEYVLFTQSMAITIDTLVRMAMEDGFANTRKFL